MANGVDRLVVDSGENVGGHIAPICIEPGSPLPDRQERLLDNVLREGAVVAHPKGESERLAPVAIEKGCESYLISGDDPLEEGQVLIPMPGSRLRNAWFQGHLRSACHDFRPQSWILSRTATRQIESQCPENSAPAASQPDNTDCFIKRSLNEPLWVCRAPSPSLPARRALYSSVMSPAAGKTEPYRKTRYKGGGGMWSWILHRGSGLMVLGFLFLHILDTSLIGFGKHHYDTFVNIYKTSWFRPLEVLLVGAVIYHSMNGLRVILVDFWDKGVQYQRQLTRAVNIVSLVMLIPTAFIMLKPIF